MTWILDDKVKEVIQKKRTIIGIKCNECGKEIKPDHEGRKYFRVVTGHHDWGAESADSREYRDICPDCIGKVVADYSDAASGSDYIEIKVDSVYERDVSEMDASHHNLGWE